MISDSVTHTPGNALAPETGIVVVAGGSGSRAGGDVPKQFRLLRGLPLFLWPVRRFLDDGVARQIVAVLPEAWIERGIQLCRQAGLEGRVTFTEGGRRRQDSVRRGVQALDSDVTLVAIHDGARPFPPSGWDELLDGAFRFGAALFALPATDSVKVSEEGEDANATVKSAIPREQVWLAQTPQAFRRDLLLKALDHCERQGIEITDDVSAVEPLGFRAVLVRGSRKNIKVTVPEDFIMAEAFAREMEEEAGDGKSSPGPLFRVGSGFDVHRLVEGRPLILGGVRIPHDRGLDGHSDADALLHALCDAILGAMAAGDIGTHFPNTDPKWKDCDSSVFVNEAVRIAEAGGYRIGNVDILIMAESPKMNPHLPDMRRKLEPLLGIAGNCIGLKAGTMERMGFVGREEGIAVHAVATLERKG